VETLVWSRRGHTAGSLQQHHCPNSSTFGVGALGGAGGSRWRKCSYRQAVRETDHYVLANPVKSLLVRVPCSRRRERFTSDHYFVLVRSRRWRRVPEIGRDIARQSRMWQIFAQLTTGCWRPWARRRLSGWKSALGFRRPAALLSRSAKVSLARF
jgi:hypothetical protein